MSVYETIQYPDSMCGVTKSLFVVSSGSSDSSDSSNHLHVCTSSARERQTIKSIILI